MTRIDIADAALTVLNHRGLDALSMRSVAAELGITAMALYRYVHDREDLERLVVDRILDPVETTVSADHSWTHQISTLMDSLRETVGGYPAAVPLLLAHRHSATASVRWIESMLAVLTDAGLSGRDRVIAQRSLVNYLLGSLSSQHQSSLSGHGTAAMADLSEDEYPHLVDTAKTARSISPDEEFHLGLAVILRGLGIG